MSYVLSLIDKYYTSNPPLRELLVQHSRQVADRALQIARAHPELALNQTFIEEAAMLHDIGIFFCNAPRILCQGHAPYLLHGYLGAELLRREGLPAHARVAERHTGAGLTAEDIERINAEFQNSNCQSSIVNCQLSIMPVQDYLPETLEEQLICYADKFYSKTHIGEEYTYQQARLKLQRFGLDTVTRLDRWHQLFESDSSFVRNDR